MKRPAKLSATFVKTVSRPGRYGDGRGGYGLTLLVKPSSTGRVSKSWSQRVRLNGKPTYLGLGGYPLVSLAEARAAALENARQIHKGVNPRTGGVPTFEQAAERHIQFNAPNWKHARSADIERRRLRQFVFPRLGRKRIDKVTTVDLLACLTPIWNTKPETARRVRQRVSALLEWSIANGYRDDNPAAALARALPKNYTIKKHLKALPHAQTSVAIRAIRATSAHVSTRLAFEFLVLTAARSGEVRMATWPEIDLDAAVWTIPAERMKAKREHRVPLSPRAVEVLREAMQYSNGTGLIFPSATGKVMSDGTVSKLLRENGVDGTPHGFRSSFRDWCAETGKRREDAEAALAHKVGGTEGAYFRSDLFAQRRALMESWAQYLSGDSAKVVKIRA